MKRFFRNLFTTTRAVQRAFPPATLKAIENRIAEGETRHRAELRIIIEARLPWETIMGKKPLRERALELFGRYGIWDTEENCGVLLYINMAGRQVEIVADRGIAKKAGQSVWQQICHELTGGFSRGEFQASTLNALSAVNQLLTRHFPFSGNRENQLPDHPVIL
ncbi:MAG: TPM domain-containing protein [Alistipes senegalensis]|nr:TPM domain-containing protein [Oxalobacter formigenes]MCM1280236.1 TPM domain-containing protein [Alistipes senegalensis]